MSKIKSYAKELGARLTGNQDKVIIETNYRKATAAVKGQQASLESELVNAEGDLADAEDRLKDAKFPTTKISDQQSYIRTIISQQSAVDAAQARVENVKASLDFQKKLLAEFEAEVEA
jgi:hypothetical protein